MTMYKLYNKVLDFSDYLKYDFLGSEDRTITQTPTSISIQFHQKPGSNFLWIDSGDYPGLFASGYSNDPTDLWKCLNDAILSYFGVPRYEAKRRGLPYSLPLPNGQAIVQQDAQKYAGT